MKSKLIFFYYKIFFVKNRNLIINFYRIKSEENSDNEYGPENLHDLIIYVFDKICLIYSYSERKLLLMALILFYYQTKGDIPKNSKYILKITKHIFFDGKLDEQNFNEESPIKPYLLINKQPKSFLFFK